MLEFAIPGGTSSIELNKTSKGFTYSIKLYFIGHDMRTLKQVIENLAKSKSILEAAIGEEVIPEAEMSDYLKRLTAMQEATVRKKMG